MDGCENLAGKVFGYWTVVERAENHPIKRSARWLCECECGTRRVIGAAELRHGRSKSCGCHKNDYNRTHGGKGTRLYEIWRQMRYRCENQGNQAYEKYGARGISVCKEWHDFSEFRKWALANGYEDSLSIDRIDNDKGYNPDNCRWATSKMQMNNRGMCNLLEFNGEKLTVSQWSEKLGIPRSTLLNRIKRGWDIEKALTEPVIHTGKN